MIKSKDKGYVNVKKRCYTFSPSDKIEIRNMEKTRSLHISDIFIIQQTNDVDAEAAATTTTIHSFQTIKR